MGGLIGKILSYTREKINGVTVSRVKINGGAGENRTATEFRSAGDDSSPLPGDYSVALRVPGTNKYVVVGHIDPDNPPESEPGEKKIYSRGATGEIAAFIQLKKDGSVLVSNGLQNGTIEIDALTGSIVASSPFIRLGNGELVPVVDGVVTPKCTCTYMGLHLQGSATVMATS